MFSHSVNQKDSPNRGVMLGGETWGRWVIGVRMGWEGQGSGEGCCNGVPEEESGMTQGGAARWREPASLPTAFEPLDQAVPEAACESGAQLETKLGNLRRV